MAKYAKQQFGHENPIFIHEERALLAAVDRADQSSSNSQIIGRNGELALLGFLNRYLPHTMRVCNGHFVTPKGELSPETDLLLLDTRFPLVAQNDDGSVLAMLHSVIGTIEVKRTLTKSEIQKIHKNSGTVAKLQSQAFGDDFTWASMLQRAVAYRTSIKIETIGRHFFSDWEVNPLSISLDVLRGVECESPLEGKPFGVRMWLECRSVPSYITTRAPLSDFYYGLVQDAYYTLGRRNYNFHDIGAIILRYLTWGTFPNKYTQAPTDNRRVHTRRRS